MRIGVVDNDSGYDFNFEKIHNPRDYSSLDECLYWLEKSSLGACLHVNNVNGIHQIDIYLDNSKKEIEAYARQFILENVVHEPSTALNAISDTVSSKIIYYNNYIQEARQELINAKNELANQELTLISYLSELQLLRSEFNSVYIPIKESRSDIQEFKEQYDNNKKSVEGNISYFESRKSEINSQILSLKSFLYVKLSQSDYNYVSTTLDDISFDLDNI